VVPGRRPAEEAYIVLREALRRAKKVAIGQLALRGPRIYREPEALRARHRAETLRYADEVNKAQGYFREIGDAKPDEELLDWPRR
jgi:DNA end-binding protein Ku